MFSYKILETLCKEKNMTVRQVALKTGIATSTLSNWKQGQYEPKVDKIFSLAKFFGVDFERFIDDDSGTD